MFRGIDPEGLIRLAVAAAGATDRARSAIGPALWILDDRGFALRGSSLATGMARLARWGIDMAATLRWRAETIRSGQDAGFDIMAMTRASFAAAVPFSIDKLDESLRAWIEEWQRREERIVAATADIAAWLSQGLTDWDVTNRDLHNIQSRLENLSAAELEGVLLALSPAQIECWIAEMSHSINGFSLDEQRDLFGLLASNASGEALGRIHEALCATGGEQEAIALGTAISVHSTAGVIVEFVAHAVAGDLAQHRYSGLAPAIAVGAMDTSGAATHLSRTLAQHEGTLELLLTDLAVSTAAPAESAEALTVALARSTDPRALAGLFASLVRSSGNGDFGAMAASRSGTAPGAAYDQVAAATRARTVGTIRDDFMAVATRFIEADANAVVEELATSLDRDGELTATYWYLLAEHGAGSAIGDIVNDLRGGSLVDLDRFCDVGTTAGYEYSHARNLAFAAATLERAFMAQADEAKGDIDAIAKVSGALIGAISLIPGPSALAQSGTGGAAEFVLVGHVDHTKEEIDSALASLRDQIRSRLQPSDLPAVEPPGFGYATRAWLDVVGNLSTLD